MVKAIREAIISIIDQNNTTTSSWDISANLQNRVQLVMGGTPGKRPISNVQYPVVFVSPDKKEDDWAGIGPQARRDVTIDWSVFAVTINADSATAAENENLILSSNLEKMFRNYIDLSGTVSICQVTDTDWSFDDENSTYVQTAKIGLKTISYGVS